MRTIEKIVYNFDELSDEAKDNALTNYSCETDFFWSNDYLETIKKGLSFYGASIKDWSIDWNYASQSYVKFEFDNDEIEALSGNRLFKYLVNNFETYFCKYAKKNQKTLDGNCPFTGFCADEDFLDEIRDFVKKPNNYNFRDLLEQCVENTLIAAQKGFEFQTSLEGYKEHCEANQYEFDEFGNLI